MQNWWPMVEGAFPLHMILRLVVAALAGGILGWERERHDKPAGLRTHMMVALGAAAFMVAGLQYAEDYPQFPALRLDPLRVLAGIIGGVGFLGAGTILEARGSVRGITTAAGIWVAAAIGTASGMGMYGIAFTSVILAVLILTLVGRLERFLFGTKKRETDSDDERE